MTQVQAHILDLIPCCIFSSNQTQKPQKNLLQETSKNYKIFKSRATCKTKFPPFSIHTNHHIHFQEDQRLRGDHLPWSKQPEMFKHASRFYTLHGFCMLVFHYNLTSTNVFYVFLRFKRAEKTHRGGPMLAKSWTTIFVPIRVVFMIALKPGHFSPK